MKRSVFSVAVTLALAMISQASGELITNGTFESVSTAGTFTSWTYATSTAAVDLNSHVIAGANSAEIIKGITAGGIYQSFGSLASGQTYQLSLDFSVLKCNTTGDRTFNMLLLGNTTSGVNMRVSTTDNGATQVLQVFDQVSSWKTITGLGNVAYTSGAWGTATPVVNTLAITLHWNTSVSDWTYDITLNGIASKGWKYYQEGLGGWCGIHSVGFQAGTAESNYLVDNVSVSVVPEPNTAMLLVAAGISLMAYAWRRRK